MATQTPNYNLVKPASTDNINIADLNGNADIIDAQMKVNADDIAELQTAVNELNYTVIKSNISFGNVTSGTAVLASYPSGVTYAKIISATFTNTGGSANYDFSMPMCTASGIRFKPTVTQQNTVTAAIFLVAD